MTLCSELPRQFSASAMWKTILLLGFVFCTCQAGKSPLFLATFPDEIKAGTESNLCTSIFYSAEPLSLTFLLKYNDQSRVLLNRTIEQDFHQCIQFQAPLAWAWSTRFIEMELKGTNFKLTDNKTIHVVGKSTLTFIRTDKPFYKPGQTVHFRIFSMDTDLNPVNQWNSRGCVVGQWSNITSNGKFLQLSYPLSLNALLGQYHLIVHTEEKRTEEDFTVKEYVMPRFQVTVDAPSSINIMEKFLTVGACASYTYGKPVAGIAVLKLCRPHMYQVFDPNATSVCHEEFVKMNKSGCATYAFPLTHFTENRSTDLENSLHFTAEIEDGGTGVILKQSTSIDLQCQIGQIIVEFQKEFRNDSIVEGKIKALYYNNTPIANISVSLSVWSIDWFQTVISDINGIAPFSINATGLHEVHLSADVHHMESFSPFTCIYVEAPHYLSYSLRRKPESETPQASPISHSTLTIQLVEGVSPCGQEQQFTVQYTIFREKAEEGPVNFVYLVLSKGNIVHHGLVVVPLQDSNVKQGQMSFKILVTPDMADEPQLLVYALLPRKKLVADSITFRTEDCFRNKVSLQFSSDQAVPGEEVTLQLRASPGSLCGLTVLDQSAMLMDPQKALTAKKIFGRITFRQIAYLQNEFGDCAHVRLGHSEDHEVLDDFSAHALSLFQNLGLNTLTNLPRPLPECLIFNEMIFHRSNQIHIKNEGRGSSELYHSPDNKERVFFPETWVWDLMEVGESGSTMISLKAPDTITSWETEAICLSGSGVGLAAPSKLTVFQPFFLELILPYSIIREEHSELKATIYNYQPNCIMVTVMAASSTDYILKPMANSEYSTCVCQWKTFHWTLIPSVLGSVNVSVTAEAVQSQTICDNEVASVPEKGRIDTVIRPLLVKTEGTEKSISHGWLLCPNGTSLKEEVHLQFPANMVEGSGDASVSVLGDILGRALRNLDGMLAMPYGCGEQNMAMLASNIYILEYLRATQQLTPALLQKATQFLKLGYQRQMMYLHSNGAFSTFRDESTQNSWLTAFVMKSFNRMQSFVYVDPNLIREARVWLESKQKKDGCFPIVGKLFNNRMKGGVTDDVTMTAYITTALLEMNISVFEHVLTKSLACLRNATGDLSSTYTTALLAYTFSLARETEIRHQLLEHLNAVASNEDGFLYWSPSSSDASSSLSVEMSAYVLLALLNHAPLSSHDLGQAARIADWLVGQQNSQGGFSSTQDTVVALQALSFYATLTYSPEGSATVAVRSSDEELHRFEVDQSNRLLYQKRVLHHIPGRYTIEAEGTGCVSVQIVLHYNIPPPTDVSVFDVKAHIEGNCTSSRRRLLHLHVEYNGPRNVTNMVIVDVSMLSGFVPDQDYFQTLRESATVDHTEIENDHVLLYLDGIPKNTPKNITIELRQEVFVENLKPAVVKVYDYYQTSDHTVTEYTSNCAQG